MSAVGDDKIMLCRNSDVANPPQAIAMLVLLIIELMMFAFIIYRMLVLKKHRVPKSVLYVYGLMIIWAVSYTSEYMIALLSYNKTYWINLYDNYPTWFTDTVPRFLVFLDLLAPLIIHTLLLIVPYFWIRNILYFLEHSESIEKKGAKLFNKGSKLYMIISRSLIIPAMFMAFFLPQAWIDKFYNIIRMIIIVEALLIAIYLFVGYKILTKSFQAFAQVSENEFFKMRMQSGFLIAICLMRCAQNFIMLIISYRSSRDEAIKLRMWQKDLCKEQNDNIRYMIDEIIAILVMHFLPIATILFIYKPEHQEEQKSGGNYESLIGSTI